MSELDFRPFARVGYVHSFYEIAFEAFSNYERLSRELDILKNNGTTPYEKDIDGKVYDGEVYISINEIMQVCYKMDKEAIKVVIFLSTFLESYIWELAAITMGESYTKDHLDKLDTYSKWKIIPKLITNKDLILESQTTSSFKLLIRFRNSLVHHKSKDLAATLERLEKSKEKFQHLHEMVNLSSFFTMVKNLFQALDKIDEIGKHSERLSGLSNRS